MHDIMSMNPIDTTSERIKRLRHRYLDEIPFVSIERARYYTEKWRETESHNLAPSIRVALAMKHVYENMGFDIDPEDKIVDPWVEKAILFTLLDQENKFKMKSFLELNTE